MKQMLKIKGQTKSTSNKLNGLIRQRIEESGQAKIITHMASLQNLFPDTGIDSVQLYFFS